MAKVKGNPNAAPSARRATATDLAIGFVLDKSGSMIGLTASVIAGFNEYLNELRAQEGETTFSLTLFDTSFVQPYVGAPLDQVGLLNTAIYAPGGKTALYDAIAFTAKNLEKRLIERGCEDEKVLIVTMTDGAENSSTDYTATSLAALVREYEAKGNWTFVYLGLGQTHEYVSGQAGIAYRADNGYNPGASPDDMVGIMARLAVATSARRASVSRQSGNVMADAGITDLNAEDAPVQPYEERDLLSQLTGEQRDR